MTRYHQLARLDYLKIFPAEEDKFPGADWRCRICGEEAGLRGARRHLQDHAITLEDYNRTFAYLEPKHEVKNELKQEQTAVRKPTPGSPWYESKKTTCRMCSKTFWHGQFIKHIKVEHGHNLRDYKSVFPEQDLEVGSNHLGEVIYYLSCCAAGWTVPVPDLRQHDRPLQLAHQRPLVQQAWGDHH